MENICAIIDAQGFFANGKFYPREIAIASDLFTWNFEINTQLNPKDLSEADIRTMKYTTNCIHGLSTLPTYGQYINITEADALIRQLYHITKTKECNRFGVRNDQLEKLLDNLGIPYVTLSDVPKLEILDKYYQGPWLCRFHFRNLGLRCSLRKVSYIQKFINERKRFKNFFNAVTSN